MGLGTEVNSLTILFLGRAMSGLFAGAQPTAQAAIADMSSAEEKKRNLSIMTFVISFGIIIGPVFGGFFADSSISPLFSFSTPFYLAAVLSLANAFWIGRKFQETYFPEEKKRLDILRPIKIFLETFQRKRVFWIGGVFLFMQLGYATFYQLIQIRLAVQFNYQAWNLGMFNAAIGISYAIAMFITLKYLLKFFKEGLIGVLSLLFTGLGLICVAIAAREVPVLVFSLIASAFDIVAYGMIMTAFSHSVGAKSQGWVMGIFGAILAISWTLTGLTPNLLSIMSTNWIIALGGMSMILSSIFMFFYVRRYPKPVSGQ